MLKRCVPCVWSNNSSTKRYKPIMILYQEEVLFYVTRVWVLANWFHLIDFWHMDVICIRHISFTTLCNGHLIWWYGWQLQPIEKKKQGLHPRPIVPFLIHRDSQTVMHQCHHICRREAISWQIQVVYITMLNSQFTPIISTVMLTGCL